MSLLAASSTERSMIFSAPATARIATCLRALHARLRSASISACAWATILARFLFCLSFRFVQNLRSWCLFACSMITWASAFAFFSWSVVLAFARSRSLMRSFCGSKAVSNFFYAFYWPPLMAAIRTSCREQNEQDKRDGLARGFVALRFTAQCLYLVNVLILLFK